MHIGEREGSMDVVLHTHKIHWRYPTDRQQPKGFRVQVGRSSGNYSVYNTILTATLNNPNGVFEIDPFMFVDVNITGTYYVKISSVHYDNTEVASSEFTINIVEPTDAVIAPIVAVW